MAIISRTAGSIIGLTSNNNQPPGTNRCAACGYKSFDYFSAARAGDQRRARFVGANGRGQFIKFSFGDIRRITGNDIELLSRIDRCEKIAAHEFNLLGHAVFGGILACYVKRRGAAIDCCHSGLRQMLRGADRDNTTSGANVGNAYCDLFWLDFFRQIDHSHHQQFGFGARNQARRV